MESATGVISLLSSGARGSLFPSPLAEKKGIKSDPSAGGREDWKDFKAPAGAEVDETSSKSTSGDVLPENSANHPDGGIHNIIRLRPR